MAININNDVNNALINQTSNNKTTALSGNNDRTKTGQPGAQSTDTVSLTDSAKLVHQLEKQLESFPVVDSVKVDQVRENLNSGNHQISSESIAAKFIQYESQLQRAV